MRRKGAEIFVETVATFALGGKLLGANEDILAVQLDSPDRLEAVSRHLIKCGLHMTRNGRFADFAIVHGSHGLSLDCDWLTFITTPEGGEVSFRTTSQYVEGLATFAVEYQGAEWIDQLGHGFMLDSTGDCQVWLDFNSGRTVVSLKD
jgi:hypothetical protein